MKIEEFEEKILTSTGWVTRTQLEQMNAEKMKKAPAAEWGPPSKRCPLKDGATRTCQKGGCAWYNEAEGCCYMTCPHPAAGRKCPYTNAACTYDCAMRTE